MEHLSDGSERLALERLSSALGAVVTGFDARALDSTELAAVLRGALLDHQLLLLRGLDLDAERFRRVAACIGPLRRVPDGMQVVPGMLEVERINNLDADGKPTGFNRDPYAMQWHSDGSAARIPPRYTLLYAIRVPERGGETSFADMYAACAALPPARRQALVGRVAIHEPEISRRFRHGKPIAPAGATLSHAFRLRARFVRRLLPSRTARHPVIRAHEETGRSCLFLGDHAWRVTGCSWSAGARLVNELNVFATTNPAWIYTHSWQVGDLVVWDNRCVLHRASEYDAFREERVMLRAVVNGECEPLAGA